MNDATNPLSPPQSNPAADATLPPDHRGGSDDATLPPAIDLGTALPAKASCPGTVGDARAPAGYAIESEIGRGGMGVVYKARSLALQRPCALKMILSGAHSSSDECERFRTEAQAIARLQHPGIVQVFAVGEHDGHPFMALEFCLGGSLDLKVEKNPLPAKEAALLVRALAEAMQAAHDARVIHRDLKPANVLLTEAGEPKITDFGLAKKMDEQGATRTGSVMGTPSYMAPEQAEGKKDVGPAADIYALGAILYECLACRPPFRAATPLDTILQVVSQEPVPLRQLNHQAPVDLETIAHKCLQKDPKKRYPTARDLADDLLRYLNDEPIVARPVGATERVVKWVRRNALVSALAACVLFVLSGGVAVSGYFAYAAGEEAKAARAAEANARLREAAEAIAKQEAETEKNRADDRARAEGEAKTKAVLALREARSSLYFYDLLRSQRDLRAGLTDRAALLLAGCPLDLRGWEWDHLRQQCHDEQVRCTGHGGDTLAVAWSPDGRTLASGGTDSTLRFWEPRTGQEKFELRGFEGWVNQPTFDPRGRWLVSPSVKINGAVIALGGNWEQAATHQLKLWGWHRRTELRPLKGRDPVAFRPDGSLLAVINGRSILLYDTTTWEVKRTLSGHAHPVFALAFTPDGKRLISGSYDVNRVAWKAWSDPAPIIAPGELKVWDVEAGKEGALAIPSSRAGTQHLALHRDGRRLVVGRIDGTVEVFDLPTGKLLHTLRRQGPRLCGLDLDRNGRVAATRYGMPAILWDIESGREIATVKGSNQSLAFSPDGRSLAFGADQGEPIRIVDATFAADGLRLQGPRSFVAAVGFSPDRRRVAGLSAGKLFLWDASSGKEMYSVNSRGVRLTFVPGTDYLVTGGGPALFEGGELYLREGRTGKVVHRFAGHRRTVVGLSCSADGRWLASTDCNPQQANQPGEVRVWDLKTRTLARQFSGHPHIFSIALSPDGALVAGACVDRTVYLWERKSGRLVYQFKGHSSVVNAIVFRPDGKQVASGGIDGTILLWNAASGKQEQELRGHQASGAGDGGIVTLAYSPDGRRLASSSYRPPFGGEVKIWDTATGTEALSLPGQLALAFDGKRLAAGAGSGKEAHVRLWEARPGTYLARHRQHRGPVRAIAASADRRRFASVGDDGTIRVWDAGTGEETRRLEGHKGRIWHVAFSTDGNWVASGGEDRAVRVWDVETGKERAVLTGHDGEVRAVAFDREGLLASGATDGSVRLWNARTGRPVRGWTSAGKGAVFSVAFSPDGKHLLSGGGEVELRDCASGELLLRCTEAADNVMALAFAADGKTFATGDWKGVLRIHEAESGRLHLVLRGDNEPIFALDHRGDCIATVGNSQKVHVWGADGVPRGVLGGHETWVAGVAFVAGGLIASGDALGEVRLWRVADRPADARPPSQPPYPENASYLGRQARHHYRAGRYRESLEILKRWDAAARAEQGHSDPVCVALLCLTQRQLSRPEAQETFTRLENLMRNPHLPSSDEASELLQTCRAKIGAVKRDAVVEQVREALFEGHHAGWTRHDIEKHLALFSNDYQTSTGRGEKPGEGDITRDRQVVARQQRLRFAGKPESFPHSVLEDLRIAVTGNEAVARARTTLAWPFGHYTVLEDHRLRRTARGWKVHRTRYWPAQYRSGERRLIYDVTTWKHLDDAIDKEADPSQRGELLLEAYRFEEAHALMKEVTAKPGATAVDWQRRAQAAFVLGRFPDVSLAARRAKSLDGNLNLPPYLEAACKQPAR